jgi:4-carboxymuconolactone decarboxylase
METLSKKEQELAAIGASIASNCIPCIEHHIAEARKAGLSDEQIKEAVRLADRVRRVPARKVMETAYAILGDKKQAVVRPVSSSCKGGDGADAKEEGCCED